MADFDTVNMNDIKESDVNSSINNTQRYNMTETYRAFTSYAGFRGLPRELKKILKNPDDYSLPPLENVTSKDEIIKLAVEMLGKIDPRLKNMALKTLSNSSIDKNDIQLAPAGSPLSSSGKCSKDVDGRIRISIDANRDITGVIAVAQNLIDAGLYDAYYKNENKKDEKRANFARESAKKFIGYAMIDAIAQEPYMNITPQQKDKLINEHLEEDFSNIRSMEADIEIFDAFIEAHEEEFGDLENIDNETLKRAIDEGLDCNEHPEIQEKIDDRIKEIAEEKKTTQYIIGDALETVVALQTIKNIQDNPQADPLKQLVDSAVNGYDIQQTTGKTAEELANDSPHLIEELSKGNMSALPENAKEEEVVMEMVKKLNNSQNV